MAGRFPKVARLRSEAETVEEPDQFVAQLKQSKARADIFTFSDRLSNTGPQYSFPFDWENKAVLEITSYDNWWKNQINDKTRNMVRKASKKGVSIRLTPFDDRLIRGVQDIYNESPLRQGRPFPHYGKDLVTLKREHETFLDRSDFIGAFLDDNLIGFAKLVHFEGYSVLMQIIGNNTHRDKAPTNALIAKAVEICATKKVPILIYGTWSRRTLGDFKKHHGFQCHTIPRYFVALNWRGKLALPLKMHHSVLQAALDKVPEAWLRTLANMRTRLYSVKYRAEGA